MKFRGKSLVGATVASMVVLLLGSSWWGWIQDGRQRTAHALQINALLGAMDAVGEEYRATGQMPKQRVITQIGGRFTYGDQPPVSLGTPEMQVTVVLTISDDLSTCGSANLDGFPDLAQAGKLGVDGYTYLGDECANGSAVP